MAEEYRVQLEIFAGPLDLLLFLLRRDELDIQDISIVRITEQYLSYVHLLEHLDPNAAGDFLVLASTLIEMKSRALLPSMPLDGENEEEDARIALVRQLLEYKRFKDAARALGSAADERQKRFVRKPIDLPDDLRGVELEAVEVWDLLAAFGRVMTAVGRGPGLHEVRYDETPIEVYAEEIDAVLQRRGTMRFQDLFVGHQTRAEVVGLFLALLELVRRRRVRAEQAAAFGEIYIFALEEVDDVAELPEPPLSPELASGLTEDEPPTDEDAAHALEILSAEESEIGLMPGEQEPFSDFEIGDEGASAPRQAARDESPDAATAEESSNGQTQ